MSDEMKDKISNIIENTKKETDDTSILTSGIYYADIAGEIQDLYKFTYNPDNPDLFDIICLYEEINDKYNKDYAINGILSRPYFNPKDDTKISYEEKNNVDILIDIMYNYYSNIISGIRKDVMDSTIDESVEIIFVKSK